MAKKPPNWVAIKKRYMQGESPSKIANDYDVTSKQIRDKAYRENWLSQKTTISDKVATDVQTELDEIDSIYGGLVKQLGQDFAEQYKAGQIGLTVQDGEGFPNKLAEHFIKTGLSIYADQKKQTAKNPLTPVQGKQGNVIQVNFVKPEAELDDSN